jgi:competence protein ComEC
MIPLALGSGALLGALSQLTPLAFLGLLGGLWLSQAARWLGLLAYLLVVLHLAVKDPWAPQIGRWVRLEGRLQDGFLHTAKGRVFVRYFPRLQDGRYVLEGHLLRPAGKRNPGGFDQQTWLRGLGVTAVLQARAVVRYEPLPSDLQQRLRGRLEAGLSPPVAALLVALTLGERGDLGETYVEFQWAGLAHTLALSGLHVGILSVFFLLLFYPLGPWRYLLAAVLLLLYVWLVGPLPSLVRAVIMATTVLLGLFMGRGRVALLPALALALFVQLLLEPRAIFKFVSTAFLSGRTGHGPSASSLAPAHGLEAMGVGLAWRYHGRSGSNPSTFAPPLSPTAAALPPGQPVGTAPVWLTGSSGFSQAVAGRLAGRANGSSGNISSVAGRLAVPGPHTSLG